MEVCKHCGKAIEPIDMSLTRLLVNRGTSEFYCKRCLISIFHIKEKDLDELVELKKSQGCSLFV